MLHTDFSRTVVLDLGTEEAECAAGLFPLHLVFDAQRVNRWERGYIKADEERNWDRWGQFDDLALQQVRAFPVPKIRLAASTWSGNTSMDTPSVRAVAASRSASSRRAADGEAASSARPRSERYVAVSASWCPSRFMVTT